MNNNKCEHCHPVLISNWTFITDFLCVGNHFCVYTLASACTDGSGLSHEVFCFIKLQMRGLIAALCNMFISTSWAAAVVSLNAPLNARHNKHFLSFESPVMNHYQTELYYCKILNKDETKINKKKLWIILDKNKQKQKQKKRHTQKKNELQIPWTAAILRVYIPIWYR